MLISEGTTLTRYLSSFSLASSRLMLAALYINTMSTMRAARRFCSSRMSQLLPSHVFHTSSYSIIARARQRHTSVVFDQIAVPQERNAAVHYYTSTCRAITTMPPHAHLCCIHPPRALSPTEPARPAVISLDGIFAVAALPEDHPHALHLRDADRKVSSSLTKRLVRSPSIAAKLKGQLRRRRTLRELAGRAEVASLRAEVHDDDARTLESEELRQRFDEEEGVGTGSGEVVGLPVLRLRRM
jgi:hypothetical protein